MKVILKNILSVAVAVSFAFALDDVAMARAFEDYEIRVVRPRNFNKIKRLELGAQLTTVMNESFIYTFLATGAVTYHFSNTIAIEAAGSLGLSMDREEKRILSDEYKIRTQIFRTFYAMSAALQYTPIYGKWQIPSGRLIYFDTYLSGGGGMTGIDWRYSEFCFSQAVLDSAGNPSGQGTELPADRVAMYPTIMVGLGQRYFIGNDLAIKWDLRNHSMIYNTGDTECSVEPTESGSDWHHNITMQVGASKFF